MTVAEAHVDVLAAWIAVSTGLAHGRSGKKVARGVKQPGLGGALQSNVATSHIPHGREASFKRVSKTSSTTECGKTEGAAFDLEPVHTDRVRMEVGVNQSRDNPLIGGIHGVAGAGGFIRHRAINNREVTLYETLFFASPNMCAGDRKRA